MDVSITVNNVDLLEKALKSIKNAQVLVGIPSNSAKNVRDDTTETNAEIGFINEFGEPSENIPARPSLFPGVIKALSDNEKIMLKTLKSIMSLSGSPQQSVTNGLESVGRNSVNRIKEVITTDNDYKPLAVRTLAERKRRGFLGEKPLIETSSFINSITYVVDNA